MQEPEREIPGGEDARQGSMRRIVLLLLLVAAIGAYSGLLMKGDLEFVFDDIRFVRDNPAIRDLESPLDFFTDPRTLAVDGWAGIYRPLRTLDFAIDWAIAGPTHEGPLSGTVRWFHARNILYHAAATLLLYLLFVQWGARMRWAALGALCFALHPVQTEAVAWISSRGDVLSLVLILAALLAHGRSRGLDRYVALSAGLLFLGLLAKEVGVVFVGLVVVTDFMRRDHRSFRLTLRRWPTYLVYAATAGAYILLWLNRHSALGNTGLGSAGMFDQLTLTRFMTVARSLVYYARITVVPVDLAQDYYLPAPASLDATTAACVLLVLGAVVWSILVIRRRESNLAFALWWFLVAILPTTSLLMALGVATADRFLYLPLVGFSFWAGGVLDRVSRRGIPGGVLAGAVLCCCFLLTFGRARIWSDAESIWSSTSRYFSPRATEWFADADRSKARELLEEERRLRDRGRVDEADRLQAEAEELLLGAIEDFNKAIRFWEEATPYVEPVLISIALQANCLSDLGRYEDALDRAESCLDQWPDMELGHHARSLALLGLGRLPEAAVAIESALALKARPIFRETGARIYALLAEQHKRRGNQALTCIALRRSYNLLPSEPGNRAVIRKLNRLEGEYQAIVEDLNERIRLNPEDGGSRLWLASTHAAFGRFDIAGPLFDNLLKLASGDRRPEILSMYANLFWQAQETAEGYERAIGIYEELLAGNPPVNDFREQIQVCREALEGLH